MGKTATPSSPASVSSRWDRLAATELGYDLLLAKNLKLLTPADDECLVPRAMD
jgi:hypothetical protein